MKPGSENKSFSIDREEIIQRAKWLVQRVCRGILQLYTPMSKLRPDKLTREMDMKIWLEMIGYSMSFVLEHLEDEMEHYNGKQGDVSDLYIHYVLTIAEAFDELFGFTLKGTGIFEGYLIDYSSPKYDKGYFEYWDLPVEEPKQGGEKTIGEILKDDEWRKNHNAHFYYVYRMSRIVKIGNRAKVLENAEECYQHVGIHFYNDAFFDLPLKQIRKQLKRMEKDGFAPIG